MSFTRYSVVNLSLDVGDDAPPINVTAVITAHVYDKNRSLVERWLTVVKSGDTPVMHDQLAANTYVVRQSSFQKCKTKFLVEGYDELVDSLSPFTSTEEFQKLVPKTAKVVETPKGGGLDMDDDVAAAAAEAERKNAAGAAGGSDRPQCSAQACRRVGHVPAPSTAAPARLRLLTRICSNILRDPSSRIPVLLCYIR